LKGKEINETTMYILNELFKLKLENQRVKEVLQFAFSKSCKLTNGTQKELQALKTIPHTEEHQKAFVMFDLTKKTATVMTADYNFCKMLGYEMVRKMIPIACQKYLTLLLFKEEVLNAPWSKFVHPDYR